MNSHRYTGCIIVPGLVMSPPKSRLTDYRARRDFAQTEEPPGAAIEPAEYPRFVIQKHSARTLHYDLRLEVDGVFKSWAVVKGPSLDPHEKRLAVEVEDHPLEYGDFEGTIPKGQYGGGTVMIWDRGFWMPDETEDAAAAIADGELKLVLAGERLKGRWVLVRMVGRAGKKRGPHNWLLIKHGDDVDVADSALEPETSVASGRTMEEIAASEGRGPKPFILPDATPGDPAAVWNSDGGEEDAHADKPARPSPERRAEPLPEFIEPQLCKPVTRPPSGANWVHEIKFDGYRMQLRIADGAAALRTRKGLDWTDRFQAIANAAQRLPDVILDGEVVALDGDGVPDFSALQLALSEGRSDDLIYFVFDLLFADGEDLRALSLAKRKARLRATLDDAGFTGRQHLRYVEHFDSAGDSVLESACQMNLEGIVSKRLDAPYRPGRGETWTKAKCRGSEDVIIGGWSGGPAALRSLLAGVYHHGELIAVGRVGTGFNARNTPPLLTKLNALATDCNPFAGREAPRGERDVTWVRPELVAEIEFAGWTASGQMRQAAYKGLREDKPAHEVDVERPAPLAKTVLASPRVTEPTRSARRGKATVMGVTLSNPAKALWPAEGSAAAVTKLDLAHYLESVGDWMMRHLKGRPCSVIRAPDGVDAQSWFQRHAMPGLSSLVTLVKVERKRRAYLQVDRIEGLIALAQIAAVEFHPWNCQPDAPMVPGRLIFDLDPGPGVAFTGVVDAALELRHRLEGLGLVAFCRTTGGKGLHVVTPLCDEGACPPDWEQAKTFAQILVTAMADDSPDRYVVNMAKRHRNKRIYLDYLRNDRMATAIAPLSPRARSGAPVAMPLTWEEVTPELDPARFSIATAPPIIAKSDAWEDYCDAERALTIAIKRLTGASGG